MVYQHCQRGFLKVREIWDELHQVTAPVFRDLYAAFVMRTYGGISPITQPQELEGMRHVLQAARERGPVPRPASRTYVMPPACVTRRYVYHYSVRPMASVVGNFRGFSLMGAAGVRGQAKRLAATPPD
ncbi:hypothetical protein DIS24_g4468 [Lasiodiplodia hormozganensis]|uniref:Uncharacterized protein n=1 Tax=Lasiodiplodia hormozganensis TaxID=869390 RepID=A0AA39YW31_9PEZI|nr:hypothetical protein DIS24_g4468 [Lasiodiplodia hormozganensis]